MLELFQHVLPDIRVVEQVVCFKPAERFKHGQSFLQEQHILVQEALRFFLGSLQRISWYINHLVLFYIDRELLWSECEASDLFVEPILNPLIQLVVPRLDYALVLVVFQKVLGNCIFFRVCKLFLLLRLHLHLHLIPDLADQLYQLEFAVLLPILQNLDFVN